VGVAPAALEAVEDGEVVVAGEGDTIETGSVEPAEDGVVVVDDVVEVVGAALVDELGDEGLDFSFGTPLAKGSRAMRASTTLTGSVSEEGVVDVSLEVAVAAGGAGTVAVVSAEAPLSRNTGTATTATTRVATTIHSLRSTRSRRSELILVLRSWCRPGWPTGRWWR
jgi:hypothetical protein